MKSASVSKGMRLFLEYFSELLAPGSATMSSGQSGCCTAKYADVSAFHKSG